MPTKIEILLADDGQISYGAQGNVAQIVLLGMLCRVEHLIVNPPEAPKVLTAPAGTLRALNGERPKG